MMQEPRHHDAAAESTPQHDDANGVANTAHETTDNDAGHETASQPPEQPEAIVAEAVPVTTIQPPAATGKLPQEQEAALLRRYGGVGATVTTDGPTVVIINNPPPKRRWRRTKRAFKALLTLLFLIISGNILLAAFGEEGLSAATNLLHLIWWPATLVRLLVYLAISWLLLPFIGWIIGFAAVMRFLIPKLGRTAAAQADARSLMTGRITDAYSNITTVKLFSHGAREAAYAKQSMEEFMVTVHAQMRLATMLHTCSFLVNTSLTLSTAALGIWLWHQGQVGVGAVATATAMALRVNGLSQYIMWESARLFENIGTVSDGMATLSKPQTILDKPNAPPLKVVRGEIKFDKVDFSYEAGKPLLQDFNLTIRPGEKVGLIGRSGAGKSTIVNLLLRFYEPQNGTISIDGQNVGDVTQESLRAQIGLVTQDTSLLHRSVRDNIVYGRPNATDEEMMQAAERAEAADFIPNLSDAKGRRGYDAHVGERGVKLSGGQRQRIAIARVMLKDAPILLLDEATSALDSEVEAAIQESLDKMMDGKTVIAIAHRLSTIAAMDRLIVLDKGHIVEQGTHAELLAQNGLYAKLWSRQSGGFLSEHEGEA